MKKIKAYSKYIFMLLIFNACKNNASASKIQSPEFIAFVKNFDTLPLPLVISNPNFLKENVYHFQTLKKIDSGEMHAWMKMDSLPPYPVYYYGQLPMLDSTYYLINYFEIKDKRNPSIWWTLMKFNFYGTLLSETNISYCVKDSNEIIERFCKIAPNYQCFYLETKGKWDDKTHSVADTVMTTRTVNLTYDQNK
jgi:hypothetical protein